MEVIAFGKRVPRMKPAMPVGLATWMLEHPTFGRDNESLSGDLLEELRGGRSAGWYFRQVSMAMGIGVCEAIREYASPLVFSAYWSIPLTLSLLVAILSVLPCTPHIARRRRPPRMQITSTVQDPIPFCRGNTLEALSSIVNS